LIAGERMAWTVCWLYVLRTVGCSVDEGLAGVVWARSGAGL
jgi:hypothetical protein